MVMGGVDACGRACSHIPHAFFVASKTLSVVPSSCSRVAYWEPAKFAQRLRDVTTSDNEILLKTEMSGGHFSFMDRYAYLRDKAFDFAWLLHALGCKV
ncbi:hypothetical protein EON62_00700 [archaeon]|nr:MAG: hypothetical protein EON62_00700 [archaeon]